MTAPKMAPSFDSGEAAPQFSVFVFETVTGRIVINELPYVGSLPFARQINQPGSLSVKCVVGDISTPNNETLRGIFTPWRYSIGIAWDDSYIVQAGPIVTSQFDDATSVLTITAGGIWRLLSRRTILSPSYALVPTNGSALLPMSESGDCNYVASLHTIAKKLVQDSCARSGFSLPFDYPADVAGTNERKYPIFEFATVGQRLQELTQVENGPDVDFAPYFDPAKPGYVRYEMRIGNPLLQQEGLALQWDYGSGLRSVSIDNDGSKMITGSFVKGNGSERGSLVAYQHDRSLVNAGWPATELVETRSSVTEPGTLQGYADANVDLYRNPVELWNATVRADELPNLGTYSPGTFAYFNLQDHRWIPDGNYRQRILGFANGQSINDVKLTLQAVEGAI